MWPILCKMTMCRKSLNTPATSVWVHKRNQTMEKRLRSQRSGGTNSMLCLLSAVSPWVQLSVLLTWVSCFVQSIRGRPFISSNSSQNQCPKCVSAWSVQFTTEKKWSRISRHCLYLVDNLTRASTNPISSAIRKPWLGAHQPSQILRPWLTPTRRNLTTSASRVRSRESQIWICIIQSLQRGLPTRNTACQCVNLR